MSWSDATILALVPSGTSSNSFTVTVNGQATSSGSFAVAALPSGWTDQDIGAVHVQGSATYASDVFNVVGNGNLVGVSADAFHFTYQTLNGDGAIVARVVSSTNGGTQFGVMIRESLDPGAKNMFMGYYSSALYNFYRATTGAASTYQGTGASLPYWVKVVRSGTTLTAYTSFEGVYWSQYGTSQTISMAQTVYAGLAVAYSSSTTAQTGTFDHVSISPVISPAPTITGTSATNVSPGSQVVITGSGFGSTQGSSVVRLGGLVLAASSWSDGSITITIPSGATSGYLVVSTAPSMNDSNPVEFTVTGQPLPPAWLDADVGPVTVPGSASYAGDVFTIQGKGELTGVSADAFHFVYQPLNGDGSIAARVVSNSSGFVKFGVMVRESLDAGAKSMFMGYTSLSLDVYYRTTSNTNSTYQTGNGSIPFWVKVVRSGNTLTAYSSLEGLYWTQFGASQTISMAQTVYAGLALSSSSGLQSGTFDNVSLIPVGSSGPTITGLSATNAAVGSQIVITGAGFGSTQGSSVARLGSLALAASSWSDSSITVTIPSGATSGPVVISVAPSMQDSNPVYLTISSTPIPTGWLDADIGPVNIAGNATYSGNVFTVKGTGNISGVTNDAFHFVYQPLTGDGSISARVASSSSGSGQVGLMIRASLDPNAESLYIGFGNGQMWTYSRTTTGATSVYQYYSCTMPYWVKVARSSNTLTVYNSVDGIYFSQVGPSMTMSVTLAQTVYAGMAVSVSGFTLDTGTFDYVSLSSAATTLPVITTTSATTGPVGTPVTITGINFGASQGASSVVFNDVALPPNSWSNTSISITIPAGATSGYLAVITAPNMYSSNPVTFDVTSQPLPSPWLDEDIGPVPTPGNVSFVNGLFTIQATGNLYQVNADAFHFVYQPMTGDGTIIARVVGVSNGAVETGIMMRNTLDSGSDSIFLGYTNPNGTIYRTSPGTTSVFQGFPGGTPFGTPVWVKLVRTGTNFTAFSSFDGANWIVSGGPVPIKMGQTIYVGLALSKQGATLYSGTFDSVQIAPAGASTPTITNLSATTGSVGSQVVISGASFGATQGSSMVSLSDVPVTVNSWTDTSITVTIPSGATSGLMSVAVGPSMNSSNGVVFTVTGQPLPSGWLDQDIGAVGVKGTATYNNGTFTIQSAGWIRATPDILHFVYQPLSTNGTITARLVSATADGAVMIRASLNPADSAVSSGHINGYNTMFVAARSLLGGGVGVATKGSNITLPIWVSVTRSGNGFAASWSGDGSTWNYLGGQTFTAGQTVYVGLAGLGPNGATAGTTVYDNVSITPGSSLPNPVISGLDRTSGAPGTLVTITGSGFGATQDQTDNVQFNGSTATIVSWSDTQIVAAVGTGSTTGPVSVTTEGVTAQGPNFTVAFTAQVTDSAGNVSTYTSSQFGGAWMFTDSEGSGCSSCTARNTIHNQYDGSGNLVWTIDALGNLTINRYDSSTNLLSTGTPVNDTTTATWSYTYNSFGEVLTATDPLGNVTTNTYDSHGNLLTVTTPKPNTNTAASVTHFAYNSLGELTTITDPLTHVTTLTYTPAGLISTITDAQSNVTTYHYDTHGNRTAVIDAVQNETDFAYDTGDRLTTITFPDHTTTGFGYDYRGRRTSVTDQNGKQTTYAYDDADRLMSVTDAAQNVTQYAYDDENNLLSITDANSHTTGFQYDNFGRVKETDFPSGHAETYTYDTLGNLITKLDRNGNAITYVYDALNRMTHKGYPDSTGVDYVYDLVGKIKQVTDPTGTYGFAYDNMGRLIGTTTQYAFLPNNTYNNSYSYDAASNRTGFTAPDGSTNTYVYDSLNRLSTLTNSLTGQFGFGYDALSRRTSLTRPNSVSTSYSYDSLSRLLSILHQVSGATIDGATYTLDNAGNRTNKLNWLNGITENYTYDPIYQLTQVQQVVSGNTNTTESYSYDAVGNRLSSLNVPTYSYNNSNELTSSGDGYSYSYDNNGNMLSKSNSSGTTQYAWDFENRLQSVTLPNTGGVIGFKYDPFDRRIQKQSNGGTTNYFYDGANVLEEVDQTGSVLARYTKEPRVDAVLSMLRGGTSSFYEQDGVNSVTSISNAAAALAQTYTTDMFGNLTVGSGSLSNPNQYIGRELDSETGLLYLRSRYYDPSVGRFLTEDPIDFSGGINFYSYVNNNPTNLIDPLGTQAGAVTWAWQGVKNGIDIGIDVLDSGAAATATAISYLLNPSASNSEAFANSQEGQAERQCRKSDCDKITQEIYRYMNEINRRLNDLLSDPLDLYDLAYSQPNPAMPNAGTFLGHIVQIAGWQEGLYNLIKQAQAMGCPIPPGAWALMNRGIPKMPRGK